jgi:predicted enzyme related to lactoylglutathione lyase
LSGNGSVRLHRARRHHEGEAIIGTSSCARPAWSVAPYFTVSDVVRTANYYRDTLGFHYHRFWGEPPSFCMVEREGVIIMLSQLGVPDAARPNRLLDPQGEAWDAYIWVADADALLAEFRSKGATIVRDICDQPYGCRDFDVEDCNGYRLCFGHDIVQMAVPRDPAGEG